MFNKIGMLGKLACAAIAALVPAPAKQQYFEQPSVCIAAENPAANKLVYQHNDKNQQYQAKLNTLEEKLLKEAKELSEWCKKNDFEYDAHLFAKTILEVVGDKASFLKEYIGKKDTKVKSLEKRIEFAKKLETFYKKYSSEYGKLINWCKSQKLEEKENVIERALKLDPSNPVAREERGEVFIQGYGWLPKETAKKFASGLREYNGKWLPKAEVDKLRKNWENAWELKSEHFTIKTNTSEEEGLEMLALAEETYRVFKDEIGRYAKLNDTTGFFINYCATKEDYNKALPQDKREALKNASGWNNGKNIYLRKAREPHETTTPEIALRHETVHALTLHLFSNSPLSSSNVSKPGKWIIEGIATFFEPGWKKLALGVYQIGLPNQQRQEDLASISKIIPLEEFVKAQFPNNKIMPDNEFYAQACALARFLYNKMPIKFCEYLEITFSQGVDEKNFENKFGQPSALNQEFQQFCRTLNK